MTGNEITIVASVTSVVLVIVMFLILALRFFLKDLDRGRSAFKDLDEESSYEDSRKPDVTPRRSMDGAATYGYMEEEKREEFSTTSIPDFDMFTCQPPPEKDEESMVTGGYRENKDPENRDDESYDFF